ncbi:ParB/RepB/Spo0J family partition protein [Ruoffia tabacinasalis]|uniref:ParB/RepB/Spo0J family partition protein n=1 Tax=Ruoffia tabacinasalis TaxID=87458 RepID=A0A5R9EKH6_9LACT|nr:ParB/RepB/Spo0J family partition protein [Ruoffia tabacinasalis]TLQ49481.1 ParB/RepB/Spo0J family partition protein [Ruoffia tabacinasalis]
MVSLESMFGLSETDTELNSIVLLPMSQLEPYPNQPFKMYTKEKLVELSEDIKQNGLLNPLIVRKIKGRKYQVLSGHNRLNALKLNGEDAAPAIIKDCTDNEAKLILVQSNLLQRQELSNREKAEAFKMRNDALKTQGKCKVNQLQTLDEISKTEKESSRTIARYIKTTKLVPELMDRFDDGELSLPTAELIAGLTESNQNKLVELISDGVSKINTKQAKALHEIDKLNTEITKKDILNVLEKSSVNKITDVERVKNALVDEGILLSDTIIEGFLETLNELKYLKHSIIE